MDTSARQRGFEIIVFPLLGELPKAIEPHLPVIKRTYSARSRAKTTMNIEYIQEDNVLYPDEDRGYELIPRKELIPFFSKKLV